MVVAVRNRVSYERTLSLLVPGKVLNRFTPAKRFVDRTPFDRIPALPPPSLPKKLFLNPRLYKRPDTDVENTISYKDISEELHKAGGTPKQIDIWKDAFVFLEEKDLPTNDFSRGFIRLINAKATDIELDSYVHAAELLLTGSKGKASLNDLISKYIDVVQRKDLSERTRSRLLLNEQVKIFQNSVKNGSLNLKDLLVAGLKIGAKLLFLLMKLL
jgi:hypothetical protein